jgi:hypothetical protein
MLATPAAGLVSDRRRLGVVERGSILLLRMLVVVHWRPRQRPHRSRHRQRSKNGGNAQPAAGWQDRARLWPPLFKQRSDICRSAALGILPNFGCVLPDWLAHHGWVLLQGEGKRAIHRTQMIARFCFRTFSSDDRSDVVVRENRFVPMLRLVATLFRLRAAPADLLHPSRPLHRAAIVSSEGHRKIAHTELLLAAAVRFRIFTRPQRR